MTPAFTVSARRVGIVSAAGYVILSVAYAAALVAGLLSLQSPFDPIGDPWFPMLEVLIILLMPFLVALMVVVHAWAPAEARVFSLTALLFAGLTAGLTCSVHFVILTISRHEAFAGFAWWPLFVSFKWPSVVYALDILAWDVFFALAALFAAPAFRGDRLRTSIRTLMTAGGVLALAGLGGVVAGDMQVRNIGIVGYAVLFPTAAALLAILFRRTTPRAG